MFSFFDSQGEISDSSIDKRTIGIDLEESKIQKNQF